MSNPAPSALCHVVFKTTPENFEKMVKFYAIFLSGRVVWRSERLAFLTYDHEHHRIAILAVKNTRKNQGGQTGLAHIAFGFDKLDDLVSSYVSKRDVGILPIWVVNHGMTMSMYYADPDGNELETQVDSFATAEEANDFMEGDEFKSNPIGVDFDPERICTTGSVWRGYQKYSKTSKDWG